MSLPHALLTSLIERPATGMTLARRFDRSIGYFWHATHQQIYRELARMESAGWIEGADVPGRGRTREYRVLPDGRAELERWVAQPQPAGGPRDAMLVQLRADAAVGPVGLEPHLRARLEQHRSRLAHFRVIEQSMLAPEVYSARSGQVRHIILRAGILHEEANVRWCQEALSVLEANQVPDPEIIDASGDR